MIDNASEKLIFEIVRDVSENNRHISTDQLYNTLSRIIVNYQIVKLNKEDEECNLSYYIEQFLSAKQLDGLSKKTTIKNYKLQLDIFSKKVNRNVEEITASHIRNYLSEYDHLKPSSIAYKVSTVKSFFGWLHQEELIQKDPSKKIKTPKFNKRNPRYLEIDELEMLRDACITPRERSLVECLYATGARLSELHELNISDIDLHTFSAKVIGKGDKERDVYFSLKAIHHLRKYLDSRDDDCEALFVTERRPYRRLSNRGIQREIGKIASRTDIQKKVTPHVLRHTLASLSLNNNMDIAVLSSILGHDNISTTQIYAHVTDENKRYQYKKHMVL